MSLRGRCLSDGLDAGLTCPRKHALAPSLMTRALQYLLTIGSRTGSTAPRVIACTRLLLDKNLYVLIMQVKPP